MKKKIIIIGGKGTAVVIAEQVIDAIERFNYNAELIGFAFDDPEMTTVLDYPILCHSYEVMEKYGKDNDVEFIYQLYRPDLIKERIALRDSYGIPKERWANYIHHSVFLARSVKMGFGNVILANSVINPNVVLGDFNTIQSNVLIGHDTKIGDGNFITGHCAIGSNNIIGNGCFLGLNTSVNNYIQIGDFAFCGMASNVIKSVPDGVMVYGNPARQVERKIKPL